MDLVNSKSAKNRISVSSFGNGRPHVYYKTN